VVGYFLLTCFAQSEPLHYAITDDPTIKGKGQDGQCMDYAIAVSSRLAANGIHGQLIFYRWHIRDTSLTGSHVFVVYRLPDESEWIVDNEIPHPKKVPREASPRQLVFLLSGDVTAPVDVELQDGLNHLSYF
jgi:predicted transglutaminase-like cysteine proteinase